jgi:hypothetical protein
MRRNLHKVTSKTLPHIVTFHESFVWEVTNHCTNIISLRFEYRYFYIRICCMFSILYWAHHDIFTPRLLWTNCCPCVMQEISSRRMHFSLTKISSIHLALHQQINYAHRCAIVFMNDWCLVKYRLYFLFIMLQTATYIAFVLRSIMVYHIL